MLPLMTVGVWAMMFAMHTPVVQSALPIFSVQTSQKIVALTFDDGPDPKSTPAVAAVLLKYKVPATFFEVGKNIVANPDVTKQLVAEGFTIGDHSWTHPKHMARASDNGITAEIDRTANEILAVTGSAPVYYRPPHGSWSASMVSIANKAGMQTVLWSGDPGDWRYDDEQTIFKDASRTVLPGTILVFHDHIQDGPTMKTLNDRKGLVQALPVLIKALRKKGYTFVSLDTLLTAGQNAIPPGRNIPPDTFSKQTL